MNAIRMDAIEHGRKTIIAELLHRSIHLPEDFIWEGINEEDALAVISSSSYRIVFGYLHTPNTVDNGRGPEYRLSVEGVVCHVLEHVDGGWSLCREFGDKGSLVSWAPANDIPSLVRDLVSRVMASRPFTELVWRRCPLDRYKYRLYDAAGKSHASIWSINGTWGTTAGNSHPNKRLALQEAETAARYHLRCAHQERLANLEEMLPC